MGTFKLTINTDNAAFDDDMEAELARILTDIAQALRDYGPWAGGTIRDINGNPVGTYTITGDTP